LPLAGTLTRQSTPVPVALSVLAKPLPVKPPLSLSTVPSTPQKPSVFSWIVTCVPPDELLELLLEDELDEELELLELLLDDELEDELLLELLLDEPPPNPQNTAVASPPTVSESILAIGVEPVAWMRIVFTPLCSDTVLLTVLQFDQEPVRGNDRPLDEPFTLIAVEVLPSLA
jgi:hypothetical protein